MTRISVASLPGRDLLCANSPVRRKQMAKKPRKSKPIAKKRRKKRGGAARRERPTPKDARKRTKRTRPAKSALPIRAPAASSRAAAAFTETVAQQGCLPYPEAEDLVYSCGSPESDGVPSSTPLGNLFGGQRLASFCQCVAEGVPVSASKVPCSSTKTLQDVIDAISCK